MKIKRVEALAQDVHKFLTSMADHHPNNPDVLVNYLSPRVYDYVSECRTYDDAVKALSDIQPKNEVFASHLLASRRQGPGETLDQCLQVLKSLSIDCNFKAVSAE